MVPRTVVRLLLLLLASSSFHNRVVLADSDDQTCLVDGTCSEECANEHNDEECDYWASIGECNKNPHFMHKQCTKSCNVCTQDEEDGEEEEEDVERDAFGVKQVMDVAKEADIRRILQEMEDYIESERNNPDASEELLRVLLHCENKHASCAFWAVLGECENNPQYMQQNCAPVCKSCEQLSVTTRCPIDPDAPQALKPGDLDMLFYNITTMPYYQRYEPRVLSRPDYAPGDTADTADYKLGPWLVVFDHFLSYEEADRLVELGALEGYERSADVGELKFDGTFASSVNSGRTSTNAWCQNDCFLDPISQTISARISNVTNTPERNSEYLQILRYEVGQFYQVHHDFITHEVERQQGPRILTLYMYLSDVEAGGGTDFPRMGLTVQPRKGKAVLWPSVMNEDPNQWDPQTHHQALPVDAGLKYGANSWIHLRDFKTPNGNGCQ